LLGQADGQEDVSRIARCGAVHTFKNIGEQPSRMLLTTTPSGIEKFFARCAAEFAKPDRPDKSQLAEIGAEHGIHFVQD